MSVRENVSLPSLKKFSSFGMIRRKRERRSRGTGRFVAGQNSDAETRVLNLSGGNQQKVVLGKWLAMPRG